MVDEDPVAHLDALRFRAVVEHEVENASTMRKYDKGEVANSFLHEMVHAILHDMGHKLNDDEGFVTNFADRLQEALETFKY